MTRARECRLIQRAGACGAAWDSLPLDIESVEEAGSNVVGVVTANGTRKNGKQQSYGAVHVFAISGGKIRRFREYVDIAGKLG